MLIKESGAKKAASVVCVEAGAAYPVRWMRWTPESVQIGLLISPIWSAKEARSNSGCICPRSKKPRSPDFLAEEQSDSVAANSES